MTFGKPKSFFYENKEKNRKDKTRVVLGGDNTCAATSAAVRRRWLRHRPAQWKWQRRLKERPPSQSNRRPSLEKKETHDFSFFFVCVSEEEGGLNNNKDDDDVDDDDGPGCNAVCVDSRGGARVHF